MQTITAPNVRFILFNIAICYHTARFVAAAERQVAD